MNTNELLELLVFSCEKTRWKRLFSYLSCRWISPHVRCRFCASASEPRGYQTKTQENVKSTALPDKHSFCRLSLSNMKFFLSRTVDLLSLPGGTEALIGSRGGESISTSSAWHKINGSAEDMWISLERAVSFLALISQHDELDQELPSEAPSFTKQWVSFYSQKLQVKKKDWFSSSVSFDHQLTIFFSL